MRRTRTRSPARRSISGGIILIGLGVLLLVKTLPLLPWILVVIALASLPDGIARGGPIAGAAPALWLIALAGLIASGALWPGLLILIGLPMIISAVIRSQRR